MHADPHQPRRALLTGATGYLGGQFARALVRMGWEVSAIVRGASDAEIVDALRRDGVAVHVHDGTTDQLADIVARVAPEIVWHLATRFVGEHVPSDIVPLVTDNVLFGAQLLEATHRAGVRSLVVTGSAWQQHDNAMYSPVSLYAATKQAFEALAAWYAEVAGMRIVIAGLTDLYGPNDRRRKLLWAVMNAERTGATLDMNDGSPYIDLLHVVDAIDALLLAGDRALVSGGALERWAVRPGRPLRLRALIALWQQARGATVDVQWGARPLRAREALVPWTAGDDLPGWSARVALEEGLRSL